MHTHAKVYGRVCIRMLSTCVRMLSTCVHMLEVCVRMQLGRVRTPYVCIHILKPKTLIQPFLLLFLYFVCATCFYLALFYASQFSVSLFKCLFVLHMLD